MCANCAVAASWIEVARLTGSADYTTDYFTCEHAEWRISWSYTPISAATEYAAFSCYVYSRNGSFIALISQDGGITTSGITYIHNRQGEFYLRFLVANLTGYAAIIEQDTESVPEFPSTVLLLLLFATGTATATALLRKQGYLPKNRRSNRHNWVWRAHTHIRRGKFRGDKSQSINLK